MTTIVQTQLIVHPAERGPKLDVRLLDERTRIINNELARLGLTKETFGQSERDDEILRVVLRHAPKLKELIDVELLVNKHVLRKDGIDPGEIRVVPLNRAIAMTPFHFMGLNASRLRNRENNESVYVTIAHELEHFRQELSGDITIEKVQNIVDIEPIHARREHEVHAIFWEAQQATRFSWGREEYDEHVSNLYPDRAFIEAQEIEARERESVAMPVFSRRPRSVRVHRYRRRR